MIIAMFRMRGSNGHQDPHSTFHRFLKRLCHTFAQSVEIGVEAHLLDDCPDPVVGARVHPFMKSSRTRGNKTLQKTLVSRWQARGGGYVTLKGSDNLASLDIVAPRSTLATRTTSEFVCRALQKSAAWRSRSVAVRWSISALMQPRCARRALLAHGFGNICNS